MNSIIINQLDKLVEDEAEDLYNTWIKEDLDIMNNKQSNFKRVYQKLSLQLDQMQSRLRRKLESILNVPRNGVNTEITELNEMFKNLQHSQDKLVNYIHQQHRDMKERCADIKKDLGSYLPEPETLDVYERFINQRNIRISLPVIGEIEMSPEEMEKRLVKPIYDVIDSRILIFDYSDFKERMQRLVEECMVNVSDIDNKRKQTDLHIEEFLAKVSPLAVDVVNYLSELNVLSTNEMVKFAQHLQEVLGIFVDVEVSEPETTQDLILARLLQACDQPNARAELLELATALGYDQDEFTHRTENDICLVLREHFLT